MTQSLSEIFIHIVFSTKNRDPLLKKDIRYELFSYIAQILKSLNSPSITIGGVEDHIHILCRLSKNFTVSKIVKDIKRNSSKWIKTRGILNFYWQNGYSVFSVSSSNLDKTINYILNQEQHHEKQENFAKQTSIP